MAIQQMLLGSGGLRVDVQPASYSANVIVPPSATATVVVTFDNDGFVYRTQNGGVPANQYQWRFTGTAANYDIRVTMVSGTTWTGSIGVWANLGADQGWSLTTGPGVSATTVTGVATIEIRDTISGAVLDSANVTLTASRSI